jgi:uncharacterized protein (DUF3820 family)
MSNQLAVQESQLADPTLLHRRSIAVANAVREGVLGQTIEIQGKKYIQSAGWAMMANAFGFVVSGGEVRKEGDGFIAKAYLKRVDNGVVVAEAEGFCDRTEPRWKTAAEYAIRSMAQTRAASKVCKMALASCVPLMGVKNLSVTPAEEVPEGGFTSSYASTAPVKIVSATRGSLANSPKLVAEEELKRDFASAIVRETAPPVAKDSNAPVRDMALSFGKYKGMTLRTIAKDEEGLRYLEWLSRQELKLGKDGKPYKSDIERNEIINQILIENPEKPEGDGDDDLPF